MQTVTTGAIGYFRQYAADPKQLFSSFRALFVLSGSKGVSAEVLRRELGLSQDDFSALLDRLQRSYLVDAISELSGESVDEYYRLTEEGTSALQGMLEAMCELPELE